MSEQPPVEAQAFIDAARAEGFVASGVATAAPSPRGGALKDWLESDHHGTMHWMGRNVALRIDPAALLPGARSVICVADRHAAADDERVPQTHGRIARYARGRDYHRHMKRRLHALCDAFSRRHPGETFRACVDTAPLLERDAAARAGLGAVGRNTMLIQQGVGSWLLLGEIVTTLAIEPTLGDVQDPCGTCTRCIDACPTDALTPFQLDARRCISYLTIEHRESIDPQFHEAMGQWIFGCDICQEVCPHNQPTHRTLDAQTDDAYTGDRQSVDLLEVLGWSESDRVSTLAGSSATRASLQMWRRNAAIAARNVLACHDDPELEKRLEAIVVDPTESEMVKAAASRHR